MIARLQERYWVINASSRVRDILSKCVICRRLVGKPIEQKMADLPTEPVQAITLRYRLKMLEVNYLDHLW